MAEEKKIEYVIEKDYGAFGDGKWQKHLAKVSWNGNDAKFDIRPWNEDMTQAGRGITLDDAEAFDLLTMLEDALG